MIADGHSLKPYWSGTLAPHLDNGCKVVEYYRDTYAELLVDEDHDYFRFSEFPPEEHIEDFYDNVYPATRRHHWYNVDSQYAEERWSTVVRKITQLSEVLDMNIRDVRIHDAGCGFGGLVGMLLARGYLATGTDLSAEAIAGGRSERSNHFIFHDRAEHYLESAPAQHVIVLNHMIEHSLAPLDLVTSLGKFLAPGGFILIRCPNSRFLRSTAVSITANWYGYPKHLHYFGPSSLRRLLIAAKFDDVTVESTDTDMWIDGEMNALEAILRGRGILFASRDELLRHLLESRQAKEIEAVGRHWPDKPKERE